MPRSSTPFYVNWLIEDFQRRKSKNPRYSLRGYARMLEIDCGSLSRLFTGKVDLSFQSGLKIIRRLNPPDSESREFLASLMEQRRKKDSFLIDQALQPPLSGSESRSERRTQAIEELQK